MEKVKESMYEGQKMSEIDAYSMYHVDVKSWKTTTLYVFGLTVVCGVALVACLSVVF